jgi:hypothetical protein
VPPHGHARVRRPEVDADRRPVAIRGRHLYRHTARYDTRDASINVGAGERYCCCFMGFFLIGLRPKRAHHRLGISLPMIFDISNFFKDMYSTFSLRRSTDKQPQENP